MVTPRGLDSPTGPAWIRSASPVVVGARLNFPLRFRSTKLSSSLCSCDHHAAQLRSLELGDVQLYLGLGGDSGALAYVDLVDLRLALQFQDLPLKVHDQSLPVLGDLHCRRFVGRVSAWWSSKGSSVWGPSVWGSSRWSSFRRSSRRGPGGPPTRGPPPPNGSASGPSPMSSSLSMSLHWGPDPGAGPPGLLSLLP